MKPLPFDIYSLRVPDTALDRGKELPTRIKFLNWGRNETTKGPFIVDDHTAQVLPLNQRAFGFDQVALDFEHNTVPGTPEYERTHEPRPVAGHGSIEVVKGDGLFITALSYTPAGEANFRNYIDPSGAVAKDDQDRVIFVQSVALTHTGSAPDVHLLSAAQARKDDGTYHGPEAASTEAMEATPDCESPEDHLAAAKLHDTAATMQDQAGGKKGPIHRAMAEMHRSLAKVTPLSAATTAAGNTTIQMNKAELIALMATLLSLPATAVEADVASRFQTLSAAKPVDLKPLTDKIETLSTDLKAVKDQLASAGSAAEKAEKDKIIALFAQQGKAPVDPATGKAFTVETLSAQPVATLQVLLTNTPATVPLSARGRETTKDGKAKLGAAGRAAMFESQLGIGAS